MIGTILAAAGSGLRFASQVPKQFQNLEGRALYLHAFSRLIPFSDCNIVVTSADQVERVRRDLAGLAGKASTCTRVIAGGATRQESVLRGLRALEKDVRWVLVHDAARPFVSPELIQRVLQKARESGACIPALRIAETVKQVEGDEVRQTLDRSNLVTVQTPQAFKRDLLERAFEWALERSIQVTDEASLIELCGEKVHWVEGDPWNIKVTWPGDLESGRLLWQNRAVPPD